MTVTVNVRNTGPQMFARLKAKAPAAIARSLNRAAGSARTVMVPAMAKDLGVKQGDVKDGLRTSNATPQRLMARLSASLKRLTLYQLGAKGPVPSRGKGRGVSLKGKRYPHAFIATMRSGHTGVFMRKGKPRLPIRELFGPSLGRVFLKYREFGKARALESFNKNLQAEFRFALKG